MNLCKFKATLDYTRSMQKQIQAVVPDTFNTNTRGVMAIIPELERIQNGKKRGLICLVCSHPALVEVLL